MKRLVRILEKLNTDTLVGELVTLKDGSKNISQVIKLNKDQIDNSFNINDEGFIQYTIESGWYFSKE
jgi:hypothetical protein